MKIIPIPLPDDIQPQVDILVSKLESYANAPPDQIARNGDTWLKLESLQPYRFRIHENIISL